MSSQCHQVGGCNGRGARESQLFDNTQSFISTEMTHNTDKTKSNVVENLKSTIDHHNEHLFATTILETNKTKTGVLTASSSKHILTKQMGSVLCL